MGNKLNDLLSFLNMKTKISLFLIILTLIAGAELHSKKLHFGIISAVKNKVKELEQKVENKIESEQLKIQGTAAKGDAIAAAKLSLKDSNGQILNVLTDEYGKFTLNITRLTLPGILSVEDNNTTYFSIAYSSGTCNIHPFTDLVVRSYFKSQREINNMEDIFNDYFEALGSLPTAAEIKIRKDTITDIISNILSRQGIDPANYDIFSSPFDTDSTGFDKVLDETEISMDLTFSTTSIKDKITDTILTNIIDGKISSDTLPVITINSPSNSEVVSGTVTISVDASDDIGILKVQFLIDNVIKSTDTTAPYNYLWNSSLYSDNFHSIKIIAYDTAGQTSSKDYAVTVDNIDAPPAITISSPADQAVVSSTVTISAIASDDKNINKVLFFIDGISKSTDTSTPYSYDWDSTQYSNSTHSITATVYDSTEQSSSTTHIVTVNNIDNPPMIYITEPANSSTISSTVTVTVSASDDNSINRVIFSIDEIIKSTDTSAPYTYDWDTTLYSESTHSVKATAYDNTEQSSTTFHIVTVNNSDLPPAISITNPNNTATISTTVTVTVNTSDDNGIDRVQFFIDDIIKSTDTTLPYTYSWDTTLYSDSTHTVKTIAFDTIEQSSATEHIVTVDNTVISTGTRINMDYDMYQDLDGMTKLQVLTYRESQVEDWNSTGIFPDPYTPDTNIYDDINDGADWTTYAAIQVGNPYFLVHVSYAEYVERVGENTLTNYYIVVTSTQITETISGTDATKWFSKLYIPSNIIEVRMVNAYDAGYTWAHVYQSECTNIDFNYSIDNPNSIANTYYSLPGWYHDAGTGDGNNYSPTDSNARIKVDSLDTETIIYVKLWQSEPSSTSDAADLIYKIHVDP